MLLILTSSAYFPSLSFSFVQDKSLVKNQPRTLHPKLIQRPRKLLDLDSTAKVQPGEKVIIKDGKKFVRRKKVTKKIIKGPATGSKTQKKVVQVESTPRPRKTDARPNSALANVIFATPFVILLGLWVKGQADKLIKLGWNEDKMKALDKYFKPLFTPGEFGSFVASSDADFAKLHGWRCDNCGRTLYPALGREVRFFRDDFKCPSCGAPKETFYDVYDPTDPRNYEEDDEVPPEILELWLKEEQETSASTVTDPGTASTAAPVDSEKQDSMKDVAASQGSAKDTAISGESAPPNGDETVETDQSSIEASSIASEPASTVAEDDEFDVLS